MDKRKKWKIGILSALIPTITTVLLVAVIGVVWKEVAVMGTNDMKRKADNYAALSASAPEGATVFFGDSITELCPIADIYAPYTQESGVPVCNRGISAEQTAGMLARLESNIIAIRPRNLVMLMGVNDLGAGVAPQQITENIRQMIRLMKEKSPQTNLILQAVYPVDPDRDSFYQRFQLNGRDNATIRGLNDKLRVMAEEEQVVFLDLTALLADANGALQKAYTYDGLHPTSAGYLAVRQAIIDVLQ